MLFHSYEFVFVFLPVTLLVFLFLRARLPARWSFMWLSLASLFFYGWWDWRFLGLLLLSITFNYGLSLPLASPERSRNLRNALLILGLVFNVGLIGYFKYRNFFLENVNEILGTQFVLHQLILPLGISFYSFQKIAYLIDAWRGRMKPPGFVNYLLFVSFFPQLIAGPIVHHHEMIPTLQRGYIRISRTMVAVGLSMFSIGLFKKLALADQVGVYFSQTAPKVIAGAELTFLEGWGTMSAAAAQIYLDYSAYSDMALGLALLFGIHLPLNFYSPYKATSILEFWRRWNLTLMRFLRDTIYIPLGGSRYGLSRRMLATLVTMLVCGIWHGAGWNYIVWGLMVGFLMIGNVLLRQLRPPPRHKSLCMRVLGRAVVFGGYVLPLAIFIFPHWRDGLSILSSMMGLHGFAIPQAWTAIPGVGALALLLGVDVRSSMPGYYGLEGVLTTLACLGVMYFLPNCQQLFQRFRPSVETTPVASLEADVVLFRWHPTLSWAVGLAVMVAACLTLMYEVRAFYYFQF